MNHETVNWNTCEHCGKRYAMKHSCKKGVKRKPIHPMSKKLSKERKTYRELREEFLSRIENRFCAVYPSLPSSEIHHKKGRGKYLNDTSTWLAVSRIGHEWIHSNVALATERGFMASRLSLVKPLNEE